MNRIEYKIVEAANARELQLAVSVELAYNWLPSGSVVIFGKTWYQPMVLRNPGAQPQPFPTTQPQQTTTEYPESKQAASVPPLATVIDNKPKGGAKDERTAPFRPPFELGSDETISIDHTPNERTLQGDGRLDIR